MKQEHTIGMVLIALLLAGIVGTVSWQETEVESERKEFISTEEKIVKEMLSKEKYQCCLEDPCTYCIEKSPGHGDGAACSCLEDVVNGVHPCGECIGEILEGHGNPYLAKYFAQAIAEEVGEEHKPTIQEIIVSKYNTSKAEQI